MRGDEADLEVGGTGSAVVACREHRTSHEIDVLATARGARPRTAGSAISFLGEAKCRDRRPGAAELRRLEHIRDVLTANGHHASSGVLGFFSSAWFTPDLAEAAAQSAGQIALVGLDRLCGTA